MNSLKQLKHSIAFLFTLVSQLHAADNATPVPIKTDATEVKTTAPLLNDNVKWAPIETTSSPAIDKPVETLNQNKREFWETRLSELNANYQELRQQAQADGVEFSNTSPWQKENNPNSMQSDLERMQTIINGMTPEERDVCTIVHRLSIGLMQSSMPPSQSPLAPPPSPPAAPNYAAPGYGYGYPYQNYNGGGYNRGGYRAPESSSWQGGGWW